MTDFDVALKDSQDRLKEDLSHYRNVMYFLGANVPIETLCLPKTIESILIDDGCVRVYDLINRDFTKIKGLGTKRLALLTSRLDEFLTISL